MDGARQRRAGTGPAEAAASMAAGRRGPAVSVGGRAEPPAPAGGRAGGGCACAPLRRRRKDQAGGDSKPESKQAASDPRGPVFDFSVELHKALILDVVVCCYLHFTRTFSFIAVIKGQYLASAFSLC